jgi:hypothetical protein
MKRNNLNIHRQTKDSFYEVTNNNNETTIHDLIYNFKLHKNNVAINDGISDFLNFVNSKGYKMKLYR